MMGLGHVEWDSGTYHLDQDTADNNDRKDISAYMGQLVVPSERQFQSHSKSLPDQPSSSYS